MYIYNKVLFLGKSIPSESVIDSRLCGFIEYFYLMFITEEKKIVAVSKRYWVTTFIINVSMTTNKDLVNKHR